MNLGRLEVLVEGASDRPVLDAMLAALVPDLPRSIRVFNGKANLIRQLPQRLAGYKSWATRAPIGVLVVVDQDRDDCRDLKVRLEKLVVAEQLGVPSAPRRGGQVDVVVRIAVEELESWLLGDPFALTRAFPHLPNNWSHAKKFRDGPDSVSDPKEALALLLEQHGCIPDGFDPVAVAASVAPYLDPDRNTSVSFRQLCTGIRLLANGEPECES